MFLINCTKDYCCVDVKCICRTGWHHKELPSQEKTAPTFPFPKDKSYTHSLFISPSIPDSRIDPHSPFEPHNCFLYTLLFTLTHLTKFLAYSDTQLPISGQSALIIESLVKIKLITNKATNNTGTWSTDEALVQ